MARSPLQQFRSATQSELLPRSLLESLKHLAQQQGVTLFMLLLAAFKVLLHRYCWQELLGITPIGIHDNFFELGGHSLLAIQAISRLRDRFGIELSMRSLLEEAPTVGSIAAVIASKNPKYQDFAEITALLSYIHNLGEF